MATERVYRVDEAIPEIGAEVGDYVVLRPGHPDAIAVVRKLPESRLAFILPKADRLTLLRTRPIPPVRDPGPWPHVERNDRSHLELV